MMPGNLQSHGFKDLFSAKRRKMVCLLLKNQQVCGCGHFYRKHDVKKKAGKVDDFFPCMVNKNRNLVCCAVILRE